MHSGICRGLAPPQSTAAGYAPVLQIAQSVCSIRVRMRMRVRMRLRHA